MVLGSKGRVYLEESCEISGHLEIQFPKHVFFFSGDVTDLIKMVNAFGESKPSEKN